MADVREVEFDPYSAHSALVKYSFTRKGLARVPIWKPENGTRVENAIEVALPFVDSFS